MAASSDMIADVVSVARGFRNGAFYGTKIRLPHALVMTFLFRSGSIKSKLDSIAGLTFTHTKNLAAFVGIYKAVLVVGRALYRLCGVKLTSGVGNPASPWHAAVAGAIGGWFIWGKYSSVNFQIVLYLLSRIIIGFCKTMAAQGVQPFCSTTFDKAYPYLATVVWACVMWLFENRRFSLHRSLAVSMDFLYHDANTWKKLADFLPSPATVAVLVYYFVYATVQKKARGGRRS